MYVSVINFIVLSMKNWIVGEDRSNVWRHFYFHRRSHSNLVNLRFTNAYLYCICIISDSRIYCMIIFQVAFCKFPVLVTDQSSESVDCSRLKVAESATGENSPDNVHMQTVSQGRSKCLWCDLKIEHLSEVFSLSSLWKSDYERSWKLFVSRREASVVQPEPGWCDCFSLYTGNHLYKRVEDSMQLPKIFGRCSIQNGVIVVETGANHASKLPPYKLSPHRYIHIYDVRLWWWKWAALYEGGIDGMEAGFNWFPDPVSIS